MIFRQNLPVHVWYRSVNRVLRKVIENHDIEGKSKELLLRISCGSRREKERKTVECIQHFKSGGHPFLYSLPALVFYIFSSTYFSKDGSGAKGAKPQTIEEGKKYSRIYRDACFSQKRDHFVHVAQSPSTLRVHGCQANDHQFNPNFINHEKNPCRERRWGLLCTHYS